MARHAADVVRVEADVDAEAQRRPAALVLDLLVACAAGGEVAGASRSERVRSDAAHVVRAHRSARGVLPYNFDKLLVVHGLLAVDGVHAISGTYEREQRKPGVVVDPAVEDGVDVDAENGAGRRERSEHW